MGPAPRTLIELLSDGAAEQTLEGTWQTLAVGYGLACRKQVRISAPLLGLQQKLVATVPY